MSSVGSLTRYRDRASQDRQVLDALLDEVLVATVSTVVDGMPWSVPMFFARDGDRILLHGSTGAGMLRHLAEGTPATVSVFALDGVVVAETAFESSANYRSAVLRGSFHPIPTKDADQALRVMTDRLVPGRTSEVPASTRRDLAATVVLEMPITPDGWILKSRSGPSGQPDEIPLNVWVGVVPMRTVAGEPVADAWVDAAVPVPASVERLRAHHR